MSNLEKMFIEDAPQQVNELNNVESLSSYVLELQKLEDEDTFEKADLNKDGIVTEEEERQHYEAGGWKNAYKGEQYFKHKWFDWNKKERWINDTGAVNHWINNKGGSAAQLNHFKNQYPTDFSKKTY